MLRRILVGGENVKASDMSWKEDLINGLMVAFFFGTVGAH